MLRRFVLPLILVLATVAASHAQWREAGGITGHELSAVAFDNGVTWIGTRSGGLYRSSADTFAPVRERLPIGWIESIIAHSDGALYVGIRGEGTYRSIDSGMTWQSLDVVGSLRDITTAGGWMFISTDRAFYRSPVGSDIFQPLLETFGADPVGALDTDGSILFAGSFATVLRSTDFGITWDHIPLPDSTHFRVVVTDLAVTPAGVTAVEMRFRFLSTDNGLTFSALEDGREPMVMKLIADGGRLIAALDDGLYTSTDGARTFVPLLRDSGQPFIDVTKRGDTIVAITQQKIFTSVDNGVTWSTRTPVISARMVVALAARQEDLFAASGVLYRSTDDGLSFARTSSDTAQLALRDIQSSGSFLFALSGYHTILRSSNDGESWQDVSGVIGDSGLPVAVMHVNGATVIAATYRYGTYYSSDYGDTWNATGENDPNGILSDPTAITSFDGRIYMATTNYLLASGNGGATWDPVPTPGADGGIRALAADRNILYAATADRTFRLSTGGLWEAVAPLPETTVLLMRSGTVYAGTAGLGVWMSTDRGTSWQPFASSGPGGVELTGNALMIYDLENSGPFVVAATGSNVWSARAVPQNTGVAENGDIAKDLLARYDRTDGTLHLSLSLAAPSLLHVGLVDLHGRVVLDLLEERIDGKLDRTLPLGPLSSGMYFLTIRSDAGSVAMPLPIAR